MPLPSNITTITLAGTFLDTSGNALAGSIVFSPPPELLDAGNAILYGTPVTATLDSSGHFSVTLICTDNEALLPVGWSYTVTEHIAGTRTYQIYLPHSLGASADLSNVVPALTLTGTVPVPAGSVAPGYGGLAYNNVWTGTQEFDGAVTMSGYVTAGSGALTPTAVKTASYSAAPGEFIPIDTTAASVVVTLPTAPADMTMIGLKLITQGAGHTAAFACGGADVLNKAGGATTGTLTLPFQGILLQYKAALGVWYVLADDLPLGQTDLRYLDLATAQSAAGLKTFTGGVAVPSTAVISANGVTAWLNVKVYGAVGNGVAEDAPAIQSAINAAATFGLAVYLPAGTYKCTPTGSPATALSMSGTQGVRLFGDNALTSVLMKNGNGVLLSMSGPSMDTTGNTHCKYCALQDVGLNGGTNTGVLLQIFYADNLDFTRVRFKDNYDTCVDTAEFWDSRFHNCVWETSGSLTVNAIMPNVRLRNSAAASGFGFSTDNVNQIHFTACRWEDFRTGALLVEQGVGSSNNPNGIFLTDCKMESSFLNGGPHLHTDSSSRGIFIKQLYCFSGGFHSGFSTAQDVIVLSSAATSLTDVLISDRAATSTVNNGVTANSTNATENLFLENVFGIYNTAPVGAHIAFGTASGGFVVKNCPTNNGTQYSGTVPNGVDPVGNVQTFTAGGTWTKPVGAALVTAILVGGGGGGGSGAVEPSGTVSSGGAGGGGGAYTIKQFPASMLNSMETVTVGTGGAGGTAVSTNATVGVAGGNGGNTSFKSSSFAVASAGTGGAGGSTGAATGGSAGSGGFAGGGGAASSATGAAGSNSSAVSMGATGGASGGGITTGAAASAGGAGGVVNASGGNAGGTAGTSGGGVGGAGTSTTAGDPIAGTGGGGGGSAISGAAGAGGAAGIYGAGGGGGGSALNGATSGAGGAGAGGIAVIVTST